ncbi:hypothetical protein LTR85_009776 [Meristemomyces frigidus]|nr:hypothetical protein LTR85_009776 [Meristemomyces frigidus]
MAPPSPDDELLSILLANLRNAAATFGEGTPPYESIRTTIEDHLQAMKNQGSQTNLTGLRKRGNPSSQPTDPNTEGERGMQHANAFQNLAYRPKPQKWKS